MVQYLSSALAATQNATPSGALCDFAGTTAPSGWLMCDGSAVSRTTYAALFEAISTTYGTGDGSTTFNVPDFRGRFARYNDNMGTGAAGRDSGRTHGTTQTQTTAKNGLAISDPGHSHVVPVSGLASGAVLTNTGMSDMPGGTPFNRTANSITTGISLGAGDAETRPINLSCNRIIKL